MMFTVTRVVLVTALTSFESMSRSVLNAGTSIVLVRAWPVQTSITTATAMSMCLGLAAIGALVFTKSCSLVWMHV